MNPAPFDEREEGLMRDILFRCAFRSKLLFGKNGTGFIICIPRHPGESCENDAGG